MTTDKEERVLGAAREVFARYGYARTTMGDVARAAGVSRPALYLRHPGKEALFGAVIRRMNADALRDIRAGLGACATLAQRLTLALDRWVAQSYDLAYAHPDARDLFDYAHPVMREVAAEFQALLADLLRDAARAAPPGVTAEALARTLLFASHGFKAVATDGADLRRLIAVQVTLTVAALTPHDAGAVL